eukprot:3302135-Pyramimonas_sp.AAC.1
MRRRRRKRKMMPLEGPLGVIFGASLGVLGLFLARFEDLCWASWAVLALSWRPLGPCWAVGSSKGRERETKAALF